ncbi:diacylglycerol kinase family protein [Novosphingobium album (ex Hu et al. 2023)]|uniref:Diacylglycerol kinase n=1 Tax=Novosphingobium album (ex Hu et al. 2023) TaxID=2930093 RepID=A0ABT0B494_9SPHN|nr:diacylglycerol kinase family protein [Novosphingobium album (ex Hu et al. 2023)]MCJ2179886.1 diacylglycerol kinase [Novosphingobium album (ex Hu et al. 2023)]
MEDLDDNSGVHAWLVCNAASGSNDEEARAGVQSALAEAGFMVDRIIAFPDEPLPGPADLDAAGVSILAVFTGDGSIHEAVANVAGWRGAVLVLPGGTMNMLSRRMHGDAQAPEIIARLAGAPLCRVRPPVIRTRHGTGLTGILAGPGTIWNEVREAMRAADVLEIVATTREAISQSANGPRVVCEEVDCGREEGYAAITVTPHDDGLEANGYYAESLGDYAGQGIALLNRNFRNGPHDELGRHGKIRLACPDGEPMGLLIDGEPFDGGAEELFEPALCEVDLVTTIDAR